MIRFLHYLASLLVLGATHAMFADEVGVRDWTLKHIGKVTHASYKHREMFGATESGAIFKLLSRTGRLSWRQVLPIGEKTDVLLLNKQTVFTVSAGTGHAYMWQATDGALLWDCHLPLSSSSSSASSAASTATTTYASEGKYAPIDMDDDGLDDVVVLANNVVTLLSSGGSGSPFWTYEPDDGETLELLHVADEGEIIYVVGINSNGVVVHRLSATTGEQVSASTITSAPQRRGGSHGSGLVLTEEVGQSTHVVFLSSFDVRDPLPSFVVVDLATGDFTKLKSSELVSSPGQKDGNMLTLAPVTTDNSHPGVAPFLAYELNILSTNYPSSSSRHGVLMVSSSATSQSQGGSDNGIALTIAEKYDSPAGRSFAYGVSGGGTSTTGARPDSSHELAFPIVTVRTSESTKITIVENVLEGVTRSDGSCEISGMDQGTGQVEHGFVSDAFVDAYKTKDGTPKCRCLLVSDDWSLRMVSSSKSKNNNNKNKNKRTSSSSTLWEKRTESLADSMSIDMVDFAALPLIGADTEYTYVDRLIGQSTYFTSIPTKVFSIFTMVQSFIEDKLNKSQERRQTRMTTEQSTTFGFNKLIISTATCGKMLALKAETGELVWERYLPGLESVHVLRSTMKIGKNPMMIALRTTGGNNDETEMIEIDASDGSIQRQQQQGSKTKVRHTLVVPITDAAAASAAAASDAGSSDEDDHYLVTIDMNDQVDYYPKNKRTKRSFEKRHRSLYFRTYDADTNSLVGYGMASKTTASIRWTLALPEGSIFAGISSISKHESVALPAHQQGNDGLLIKYLNPHVVIVAALHVEENLLSVYMLDTITGHIVRQYKHRDASLPIHVDRSENWAFVTYYNVEGRRTEISSISMYEGEIEPDELNPWSKTPLTLQDDHHNDVGTLFSSFTAQDPVVLQKTFVFPSGIKTMVTTQSKRGITNKHLVIGLVSNQMLLLDRRMLDPRRPIDAPSLDDKKEGLFQYSPIVQYNTGGIVTYTKSIPRLRDIYTVPVELESTSLLLGVGLDFFYVRSQPARGFDLIPSDFSYAQLMLICGGLMVAVMYASSAVKAKNLQQKWG